MKKKYLLLVFGSLLLSNVFGQSNDQKNEGGTGRIIQVDFNKEKGPLNTSFKACVGAGRANEGLRADWQQQLAIAKKECGFKYIRMHGLLTDDMAVYSEDNKGNPQYNYQYVDVL